MALSVVPMLGLLSVNPEHPEKYLFLVSKTRSEYDAWEYSSIDYRIRFGRTAPVNPEIVFLAVDSASMSVSTVMDDQTITASHPLSLMRNFPYPREIYALICDRLFAAGARVVAFDIFFPGPTPNDPAFQSAIDRYRDKVVIGMNFSDDPLSGNSSTLNLPSASLFPEQNPFDDRLAFLNFWPDTDDVVRNAQYRTNIEHVNLLTGAEKLPAFYSLAARMVQKAGHVNLVPNDLAARTMRYAGPPLRSFHNYSLYEIFDPHYWEENFNNGDFFRGKIVLVGPQGDIAKDKLRTPYGLMDGAEIHLNAINAVLQNDFLHPVSDLTVGEFVIGSGIVACLLAIGIASIAWRFLAVLLLLSGYGATLMWTYNGPGLLLPVVGPAGVFATAVGLGFVYDFVLAQIEKLQLRTTFERYSSPNVTKYLLDHSESYQEMLVGTRTPVTVLFSDVRGFTTMTEVAASEGKSQEHIAKLNEYLTEMVACVFRYDGALDKFIGDAVMAVWGNTPYNFGPKGDAVRAVRAALAMLEELRKLNAKWKAQGRQEWQIGIGLNHGEAIVGDIGSRQRTEFAVIGDAVNLASRLESLTKEYHLDLLLGASMAELVRDEFYLRTIDLVAVKGKSQAVETFAVLGEKTAGLAPEVQKFLESYEEGVRAFRSRAFERAAGLFTDALKVQPGDEQTEAYLATSREFVRNPPDASWTGVRVMTSK